MVMSYKNIIKRYCILFLQALAMPFLVIKEDLWKVLVALFEALGSTLGAFVIMILSPFLCLFFMLVQLTNQYIENNKSKEDAE